MYNPSAKGGDPKFSDIVFFSADHLSLGLHKEIQGGVEVSPLSG